MEDAHKLFENSKIGVSRHLDSSTTTQMTKIMVQDGGPSRSSRTKSVWSSFGRTVMGKTIWENPIDSTVGRKVSKLWMSLFVHRQKGLFLSVYVDDIKLAGKKQDHWSDVEITQQRSRFGRTNIFPWSCILGMHSKTMWNKQRYWGQLQNHVWIENFRGEEQKSFHTLRIFVFLHGLMTWLVMQRSVWSDIVSWQTRRLNNSTKVSYSLHRWPPLQRRKNKTCWRIVTCLLSNCSEML